MNYQYTPDFFGVQTSALLVNPIGYNITIELIKISKYWRLSNLSYKNNLVDSNYDVKKYISDFFYNNDSCSAKFVILKKKKQVYGLSTLIVNELNFNFENMRFRYLGDIGYSGNNPNDAYGFSAYKETFSSGSVADGWPSFLKKKEFNYLEFIFYDFGSNIMLVSNGNSYGFYDVDRINEFKEFITSKLIELD